MRRSEWRVSSDVARMWGSRRFCTAVGAGDDLGLVGGGGYGFPAQPGHLWSVRASGSGRVVLDVDGLIVQVLPVADSDAEELADLAGQLQAELLGVDAASVAPLPAEPVPEGAKGLDGTLAGWLLVQFGTPDGLRSVVAVVATVRGWASRTGRTVEVSIGGDVLRVTAATSQQQEKIIDTWLARHAPGG